MMGTLPTAGDKQTTKPPWAARTYISSVVHRHLHDHVAQELCRLSAICLQLLHLCCITHHPRRLHANQHRAVTVNAWRNIKAVPHDCTLSRCMQPTSNLLRISPRAAVAMITSPLKAAERQSGVQHESLNGYTLYGQCSPRAADRRRSLYTIRLADIWLDLQPEAHGVMPRLIFIDVRRCCCSDKPVY